MDIYVHTDGGIDAALELAHWVSADPRVPPADAAPAAPPAGDDRMGAATELLQFAVSNAIALAALLVSIARWRQSRAERPTVRISTDPHGAGVTVESDDPEALAAAVRALGGA